MKKMRERTPVIHPFLFALAPILFVYVHNSAQVPISPKELVLPMVLSLAAAAVIWAILGLILRNATKAALIVSLFLALVFLYGHVARLVVTPRFPQEYLLAIWLVPLGVGTWLTIRTRSSLAGLTMALNIVAGAILLTNLAAGIPILGRGRAARTRSERAVTLQGAEYPDIYYIILDTYTRADVLQKTYHTDVSGFLDGLRADGFFVPTRSRSNYAQTYLSLASSLNLTYLDSVVAAEGPASARKAPVIEMINNSKLVEFLKRHGYTVVSFATGYTGTDLTDADVHFSPPWSLSEFQDVLLSTTVLPVILMPLLHKSFEDLHRDRVLFELRTLPDASRGLHPAFVFAHVVSPHTPFVFDARGNRPKVPPYLRIDQTGTLQSINPTLIRQWFIDNYGPQVTYLNVLVKTAVERILRESSRPPVIILQGDHGPGALLTWDDPSRDQLEERHAILYAIHDPYGTGAFYDSITPVNTFRILLSQLFDTTIAARPDRSYFSTLALPYRLYDIDHPETYPERVRDADLGFMLDGVAFTSARRMPANIATYSRQLANIRYRGMRTRIGSFFVRPVTEQLTPDQAFALYRQLVGKGELPDLGDHHESYVGPGPEQDTVVALFFRAPSRGKMAD